MADLPEVWMGIVLDDSRHELILAAVAKSQAEADDKIARRMPGRPSFVFSINGDTGAVWNRVRAWLSDQKVPNPNRLTRMFWRLVSRKVFP